MSSKQGAATDAGEDTSSQGEPHGAVGAGMERREDFRLLTGRGRYTDDLVDSDVIHLRFVRSPHGHARVADIETGSAETRSDVLGVFTWAHLRQSNVPGILPIADDALDCEVPGHPILARNRVRYDGQPVAAVVAETRGAAADAVRAVSVSYEPLSAVTDPVEATEEDAPTLYESAPDNVAVVTNLGDRDETTDAFAAADRVVELEVRNNRLIPSAIEPRAAVARTDGDGITVEMTSQSPHGHRRKLAHTLGRPEREIRVIAPDVGGGFGHKGHHHPGEAMAAWCASELDRTVSWTATRPENSRAGAHGRDHVTTAALALDDDGTFRGLRADTYAAAGAYSIGSGAVMPGWYGRLLSGQYAIPAIHCETRSVFTNTAPIHSYRGAGRPEAIYVVERLVAAAARETGLDPVDLRRRNQLEPDALPYETPVGASYDSGRYGKALDEAVEAVASTPQKSGAAEKDANRYRGVGYGCYVESTGGGFESGVVRVHPDGSVTVYAGTHSHGQGHATTYAQVVADELGVPMESISVVEGDTERIPKGTGTFGSRSTITGGNAVAESARKVRERARQIAASELGAAPADLMDDGADFQVPGAPEKKIRWADVARTAYSRSRPEGLDPGLEATTFYEAEGTAYTYGAHAAIVTVDIETGAVEIDRYVAVDDPGPQINPTIVEGQVHGGVAQGIGQALYEAARYTGAGGLETDSMARYGTPRAPQLPEIETLSIETPSPRNPLGVKGIGEAGTIAAPPAVVNAVLDALEPLGVNQIDMPLTPQTVWQALQDATDGQ